MLDAPKTVKPEWKHYRVIHSKYPTINIFANNHADNLVLGEIENMTASRSLLNLGNSNGESNHLLSLQDIYVDKADLRYGDGWGAVMASFAYPRSGRYSTDKQGAYYCSDSLQTSLREWAHHTRKYWVDEMKFTSEVSAVVRCYTGHFEEAFYDARNRPDLMTEEYDANHRLLAGVLMSNMHGILYNSMRDDGGLCVAITRPPATSKVIQSGHYAIMFDGEKFTNYSKLGRFISL
ncbi:RES family NAD+ phosphorylase [Marinomonas algicola]|uniref:RES family NAD+ phosphorylase n=1 Tax=Marinomonas algicola TaxID=2773454 RepID=UPI00174E6908|nr:RES family NAD+ phosphorylase [Marinomonas algicola]